jgi:hypothetical protein
MNKSSKIVTFLPSSKAVELVDESPVSAKRVLPDWYKKSPAFDPKKYKESVLKQCMPFFDATVSGYIQRTWADIFIGSNDDGLFYESASGPEILSYRENSSVPVSDGYYPVEFIWQRQWSVKLPSGYSLLVTHPHNRLDLPFTTLSGVVDNDLFYHTPIGSIPFYVHKGFTGIIPAGTPMYQIIPIKRENWDSKKEPYNDEETRVRDNLLRRSFYGAYRNLFWQKKTYN